MAITSGRNFWCLCSSILLVATVPAAAATKLFESVQVTQAGEYTFGIEGPAADLDGNLFVVNFGKAGTIGRLPAGGTASELFTVLPEGSVGNAIRFDRNGTMFIADYKSTTSSRPGGLHLAAAGTKTSVARQQGCDHGVLE